MKVLTPLIPILTLLGLTVIRENVEIGCSATVKNGTFNHPNFIIYLTGSHLPSKDFTADDVENYLPLIEKISTEFSQISCMYKHVPIAVATHNKLLSRKQVSEGIYQKPLEVYLQNSIKSRKGNTTFVEAMVELADKSNDIFPGTVKYILGYYNRRFSFDEGDFIKHFSLSETRKRFMDDYNSTNKYKLGIMLPLDDCEKAMLKFTSTLSNYVQLVAFNSPIVSIKQDNLTLIELFTKLTQQFELCANAVKSINPGVELIFQTGISDTDPNTNEHDYLALVTFWEMVNDWAIANDVKVIIFEAFDTPNRGILGGTTGLWKLARNPRHYDIPEDFIFMDKRLGNFSSEIASAESDDRLTEDFDFKHDNFIVAFDSTAISEYDEEHYYHQEDFLPLIRTIAAKFSSVCLLKYDPVVIESVAIYNSMTMQNRSSSNSLPLRLYPLFNFIDENNLDYALNATKTTNVFFPDTVKYLLFHYSDLDKLFSYVSNERETVANQTIELGITLPLQDCLRGTSARTRVSLLFPYVKLIIITIATEQEDYDAGVEETVIGFTKAFATCKRKIERLSLDQSLKFVLSLEWADTDSHSIQNVSNFVSFWGKINNWAKITNTTVLMTGAFDDSNERTFGWWRQAGKPKIYELIAEYVYEDKTERRNKISNGIPYVGNNTFQNMDDAFTEKWQVTNSSFSRTNFIVQFSPIMLNQHTRNGFDANQIRTIILKLFTRFSSICTEGMYKVDLLHNSMRHVPLEVARLNLEGGVDDSRNLYLAFFADKNHDVVEAVLKVAQTANSIFAGSVQYLIAFTGEGSLKDEQAQLDYFGKAKNLLREASSKVPYKLGCGYSIDDCGHGRNVNKKLIPFIKVLDLITFDLHGEDADYEVGVYESFRGFTKQFERCKEKILRLNLSIEVAFRTSWSDTTKYHGHGYENLVLFWEKMNEWAVATNTKVFMLEAFDSQNSESVADSKLGWWRLLSEEIKNGSSNYIFEEKRQVVLGNLAKKNLGKTAGASSHSNTVLISVLTALIFSGLTAFTVFLFVYRRYKNKLVEAQQYILTKKEEEEFLKGIIALHSQSLDVKLGEELAVEAHLQRYNKDYEVEREYFKFDEATPLGSGEFGIVCKGTVTKDESEVDVAVKTLKKSCSSDAVKNLLAEIKVMIHLGKHENIVSVIGAHTEGLRRGNVLLFTELCEKGSLENYLRELRRLYVASARIENELKVNGLDEYDLYENIELQSKSDEKRTACVNGPQSYALDQNLLSRWSYEIANGMEFIVSKKVVHADLATRNVLLTDNLTAKISDFGLSRRLYNYTNYVKTQTQPLPWKWMSPESLRRSEFNEKTDVWAFGITLWEIYSLGDAPYPGLSWTVTFPSELEGRLRPQEPEFNANSMYSVMLRCWNTDPNKRPTFLQLKEILRK